MGAGEARTTGARLSKSNILVFIDWDCRPHKNWLENLIRPIIEKNAVAVGGKILTRKENNILSEFSDFIRALREPVRNQKGEIIIIITANAAFSKKAFSSINGFDSRFSASGGEDLDLTYRLSEAGYSNRFFYEPNAILEHVHRSDLINFLKQQFNYGFWDMYHFILRKRDPMVLGVSLPTPINILVYVKDSFLYSIGLISTIPKNYGLFKKYILFPSISFIRKLAVMFGGIKCYYFYPPKPANE